MTVVLVKSTSVTNLDTSPPIANTEGIGAAGRLKQINDSATAAVNDGVTALQIIKVVRIPTTAKVKAVRAEAAALSKGTFDVGIYASAVNDGTPTSTLGTAVSTALFATALDFTSAYGKTDVTNESGSYTLAKRNQPIWQAAGLATDPGGFFDVAFTQNAITVVAAGLVGLEVDFI